MPRSTIVMGSSQTPLSPYIKMQLNCWVLCRGGFINHVPVTSNSMILPFERSCHQPLLLCWVSTSSSSPSRHSPRLLGRWKILTTDLRGACIWQFSSPAVAKRGKRRTRSLSSLLSGDHRVLTFLIGLTLDSLDSSRDFHQSSKRRRFHLTSFRFNAVSFVTSGLIRASS